MPTERFFAEFETDKVIRQRYFPDYSFPGVMIEVGGGTPEYLSMSKHFQLNGWRTIVVEPNPNFVALHRELANEVYEFACSDEDRDDVPFQVVNWLGNQDYRGHEITDHSFSSLQVKDAYLRKHNYSSVQSLPHTEIRVRVRKLDTLIADIGLLSLDFLSVDVEGWELEVMRGFTARRFRPRIILLENYLHDADYTRYMEAIGYRLDVCIEYNYLYVTA